MASADKDRGRDARQPELEAVEYVDEDTGEVVYVEYLDAETGELVERVEGPVEDVATDTDELPTAPHGDGEGDAGAVGEPRAGARLATSDDGRTGEPLLSVQDLRAGYGQLPVLHGISFDVYPGETAVLLGLNGAGKSTTMLNIAGVLRPWSGRITFEGRDATYWNTGRAVKEGIVMIPEGRRVFPDLSVDKNLQMGAWARRGRGGEFLDAQRERIYDYFPQLRGREAQLAGTLSGGEQQMLAIGRGLMSAPKLLIIDEASLGLAPVIVKNVFSIVSQINADGTTVVMVEQNVGALEVADLGLVVEQGRIVADVRGDELEDPAQLRELFLG